MTDEEEDKEEARCCNSADSSANRSRMDIGIKNSKQKVTAE